jgi:hypothetical protein
MLHYLFKRMFSHGKGLNTVDWLVKILRALVVKGAVVIDCASNVLFLVHNNFGPVEDLVEKSVADTNTSFCYKDTFENFFVLVLNKIIFGLFIESGLKFFYKFDQKFSFIGVLCIEIFLSLFHQARASFEVISIFVQKI